VLVLNCAKQKKASYIPTQSTTIGAAAEPGPSIARTPVNSTSESSSSSSSFLAEQEAAASGHLQFPQHPPKCPGTRRHSRNGYIRTAHRSQGGFRTIPRDCMSMALMYEGRCRKKTCSGVMPPGTNCTSRPAIARTARPRRLCMRGASCWPATRRVGTCAIWPAAAAALYKTRALYKLLDFRTNVIFLVRRYSY
jgi:hypothetical protein